ncbi:MAG TPA: sulfite exporter TauE/SafE family protein [Actinomycetota bacterium]|nr:sulfite exporter TauE/SafE family protein [Actinomycetota bacterium]
MIETISPVVHGTKRHQYRITVALHVLGATLAAALLGASLGALGALSGAPWGKAGLATVAIVAAVYAGRELFLLPVPLPDRHRQVPAWWRTFFSPRIAGLLYGLGLGIGFLTFLSYGTFVAVAVAALASGDPVTGMLVCAPFGLARGSSILVGELVAHAHPREVVDRLESVAQGGIPRWINGGCLTAIALSIGWPG